MAGLLSWLCLGRTIIRRIALTASAVALLALTVPRATSAAISLALPPSDYPPGAKIAAFPPTNDQADRLLGPVHRTSFAKLQREDGLGWLQAAIWHFTTG